MYTVFEKHYTQANSYNFLILILFLFIFFRNYSCNTGDLKGSRIIMFSLIREKTHAVENTLNMEHS